MQDAGSARPLSLRVCASDFEVARMSTRFPRGYSRPAAAVKHRRQRAADGRRSPASAADRCRRRFARHATLTMRTSTMWEPGTSAAHGVKAEWKIRNSKFEIRNSEGVGVRKSEIRNPKSEISAGHGLWQRPRIPRTRGRLVAVNGDFDGAPLVGADTRGHESQNVA